MYVLESSEVSPKNSFEYRYIEYMPVRFPNWEAIKSEKNLIKIH